jgi:hypothetical protein
VTGNTDKRISDLKPKINHPKHNFTNAKNFNSQFKIFCTIA